MDLVLVEWRDAFGVSADWIEITDLKPMPMTCRSVGWLAHEDDENIVVVPHLTGVDHERADPQGCGDMTIPRSAIVRMTRLEQDKQ